MMGHDNLEEYRDAQIYDSVNGGAEIGGTFFGNLAHQTGGPILELACGTGRLTIPLAAQGFDITGIDITPEMLERAKQKANTAGVTVNWILGDVRTFRCNQQFRMVFSTGNSFQAFLNRAAQEDLFKTVYEHLHPDGILAFETRNPMLSFLSSGNGEEEYTGDFTDEDGHLISVSERRCYDHANQIEHYVTYRRWTDEAGSVTTRETRVDIRYVFPQELESLLHYNGFALVNLYGNFDAAPFTEESPLMVCVCRKR